MKALVCEMCGSNELIKQDGLYVCQSCGTKYTVEEARKLMIEGPVTVTGTVKIDKNLYNLRTLGDEAFARCDFKEAFNYYTQVVEVDATDYERKFKRLVAAASSITLNQTNLLNGPLSELGGYYRSVVSDENLDEAAKSQSIVWAFQNTALLLVGVYNLSQSIYITDGKTTQASFEDYLGYTEETVKRQILLLNITNEWLDKYPALKEGWNQTCDNIVIELEAYSAKYPDSFEEQGTHYLSDVGAQVCYELAEQVGTFKKRLNPDYKLPSQLVSPEKGGSGVRRNGCYIATAVYGSYDCPPVWTLRRFRDRVLAASWYGRTFIRVYYAVSPSLVRWFGGTVWFRRLWKSPLDVMVAFLQERGF